MRKIYVCFLAVTTAFGQAPAVTVASITNHFSFASPGMPNGGIAQGSLFDIAGKNLGPADAVSSDGAALSTALAGTSVTVTAGGKAVSAYVVSVSAERIVALLPSSTPLGAATLVVTANGVKSAAAPFTVVKTAVGIQTANLIGNGPAAMQMPDGNGGFLPNSPDATIQPGQTAVFYGTGLGAVTFDETTGAPMQDLDVDFKAYIGGQAAQVSYKGRAPGQMGVDEFDVVIPDGIVGCNIPVAVVAAGVISNYVSIAAGDGGPCPDPIVSTPLTGTSRVGGISLARSVSTVPVAAGPLEITADIGSAAFSSTDYSKITQGPPRLNNIQIGKCIVSTLPVPPQGGNNNADAVSYLDAGTTFTVKGPNGTRTLARQPTGYSSILGTTPFPGQVPVPPPPYLSPGSYTFDNGAGGVDVGPFTATFDVPPPVTWTNADKISPIQRSQDLDITWTGGDPNELVSVGGTSVLPRVNGQSLVGGNFSCSTRASDGHLTVPSLVLMVLPPSTVTNNTPNGSLLVASGLDPRPFTAPGVDTGLFGLLVGVSKTVEFR